jgi:hypothetical protein
MRLMPRHPFLVVCGCGVDPGSCGRDDGMGEVGVLNRGSGGEARLIARVANDQRVGSAHKATADAKAVIAFAGLNVLPRRHAGLEPASR